MTRLETSRLVLRPPRLDDAPSYALGIGEYAVARWLTSVPWPYTLAMARDWLRRAPQPSPDRAVFIVELPGRGVIGSASWERFQQKWSPVLRFGNATEQETGAVRRTAPLKEFGFWIARPFWGRGYATEAAEALIGWHFAETEAMAIGSSAQHDNQVSLRVQHKLGFREIGRETRFSEALQLDVEHVVTELTRQEWSARALKE
jgi:RimJ/RimL family protein N-acetyltransferase